jgi:hypothetical protein
LERVIKKRRFEFSTNGVDWFGKFRTLAELEKECKEKHNLEKSSYEYRQRDMAKEL